MKKNSNDNVMMKVKKVNRKERARQRQAEANARRRVAKDWAMVAKGGRYKRAAAKESCRRATLAMEEELFDGILLNLSTPGAEEMSYHAQKRVLRRIVEKRQAQAAHRMTGRTGDQYGRHMQQYCISRSMHDLHRYQMCV